MHATWHALQPMHLVTSMSLATWPLYASRTCGSGSVVAERRTMSSDCRAIVLDLLDLDEERLELGRLRVAVADDGRERVGEEAGLRDARESPVDRNADRVHDFPFDRQRPDALRDHRDRFDVTAVRAHLHAPAVRDADFGRERFADLDELLGLNDRV